MEQMTPVLVVTPHPDDAEGGAGGTIARWTKQGRKVVLVVCTNGDKGTSDRNVKPADLARLRAEEQRQAAAVLGIAEVVFLHFPDQGLEDCSEFREKLVRQIRIHRPETVVTIDPHRRYIRHRDHAMCGRVTLDAIVPYARAAWLRGATYLLHGATMAEKQYKVYVLQGRHERDYADCQNALAKVPADLETLSFIGEAAEVIERTHDADGLIVSSSPITREVM